MQREEFSCGRVVQRLQPVDGDLLVPDWKVEVSEGIGTRDVARIIAALHSQASAHAGTANANVKSTVIKLIRKALGAQISELLETALLLCTSENPSAEEVGAQLLVPCYPAEEARVADMLMRLADSSHWEVREWVASACGSILEAHFAEFYPVLREWAGHTSANVRRAVVLACMYAAKSRKSEFSLPILDVLHPLMEDRAQYVKENLGPFALGDALIRYYPDEVMARLRQWVLSGDEQVRWNVAMVFSTAASVPWAAQAHDIFAVLQADERPYVQKAVRKALRNLEKRGVVL